MQNKSAYEQIREMDQRNEHFNQRIDKSIYGPHYRSLLNEIVALSGDILPIEYAFNKWSAPEKWSKPSDTMSSGFSYRNLSQLEGNNLLFIHALEVDLNNVQHISDRIKNKVLSFYFTQGYEIFESFLLNCFATLFEHDQQLFNEAFPKKNLSIFKSWLKKLKILMSTLNRKKITHNESMPNFNSIRKELRQWREHQDYIKWLKRHSRYFEKYSYKNQHGNIDLRWIIKSLSYCRHDIVHNRLKVSTKLKNQLSDNSKIDFFKAIFNFQNDHGAEVLNIKWQGASFSLELFVEIAGLMIEGLIDINSPIQSISEITKP